MYKKMTMWIAAVSMMVMLPAAFGDDCDIEYDEYYYDECDNLEEMASEEEVMEFLEKNIPIYYKQMKELKKDDEMEYEEVLDEARMQLEDYNQMLEYSPEEAKLYLRIEVLNSEAGVLAEKYSKSEKKSEKEGIKKKLSANLDEVFDSHIKIRMMEVEMLSEEINEIKSMVEKRKSNKDKIIDRRLTELLSAQDDELDWW